MLILNGVIQGGATGGAGVNDHALLLNLGYVASLHTGFQPAMGADDNYVTDAEKIVIGNTSGTNSGNETSISIATIINAVADKALPLDADRTPVMDSADGNKLKKSTWTNIKAFLKTYFDGLYTSLNVAIVSGTKTKISYDTKGLVTSGSDATTADIADSLNARYCTDAEKVIIGNTSGANSGNETVTSIGTLINGSTAKNPPVNADMIAIKDSVTGKLQNVSYANMKAAIGSGGAVGSILENDISIIADYTITTGKNALSVGPIAIAAGVLVTIPEGSQWKII